MAENVNNVKGKDMVEGVPPAAAGNGNGNGGNVPPTAADNGNGGNVPPPKTTSAAGEPTPDPFDPERLRLTQNFAVSTGVQKLLTTVPVRKPAKEWWIQTHPAENYRIQTAVLELKEDREIYLVDPTLWPALAMERTFSPRLLVTTINRQGILFLWPIRLPGSDGKIDNWSRSALEAAQAASGTWVRVASNMNLAPTTSSRRRPS